MNIGQASGASGVSAKMIRYYEQIGLVRSADRTDSNYRSFGPHEINELRFIKRARTLGFSVKEIETLLSLWRDRERPSREVKAIADRHKAELMARIAEMQSIVETLEDLSTCCLGDERPDCPILADLSGGADCEPAPPRSTRRRAV